MSSLLLLGASGYIGGSLLVALKESNPELEITCLVRSASHVDPIRAAGAQRVVLASDNLLDEAERISSQSDAVINLAGADSLDIVSAVLRGLKKRFDEGKGSATLIHTSGSAIFSDGDPDGKLNPKSKVWNDGLEEDIRAITTSQHHGQVDVPVLKAGEDGYVHTYIICPTVIYGPGTGPINKFSAAEKFSTQPAQTRGHAFYVGEGSNVTGSIHINDVVSLFILILNKALSAAPTDSPYARYYIADAKVVDFKTLATITGNVLFKKGLISSPEPKSIPATELGPLGVILGSSMPTKDVRARALGWSPTHSEADFVEVYTKDLEELLNAQ